MKIKEPVKPKPEPKKESIVERLIHRVKKERERKRPTITVKKEIKPKTITPKKITPKKVGQFVTFWKRNGNEPIEPLNEADKIDFYVVNVRAEIKFGQFVFPKSILIKKGIVSTDKKEGKRGFRVYPLWNITGNKQATKTQKWQLNYFLQVDSFTDLKRAKELYGKRGVGKI